MSKKKIDRSAMPRWFVRWDSEYQRWMPKTEPGEIGPYTIHEARKKAKELNKK